MNHYETIYFNYPSMTVRGIPTGETQVGFYGSPQEVLIQRLHDAERLFGCERWGGCTFLSPGTGPHVVIRRTRSKDTAAVEMTPLGWGLAQIAGTDSAQVASPDAEKPDE